MQIHWIDPKNIFLTEGPALPVPKTLREYYDKSELGNKSYLTILPSIALYGFKYVVVLNQEKKVLDGNYRVYAGLELGLKIPVVVAKNREVLPKVIYFLLWVIRRRIVKRKYFLQRKIKNPFFVFHSASLSCHFQKNILEVSK